MAELFCEVRIFSQVFEVAETQKEPHLKWSSSPWFISGEIKNLQQAQLPKLHQLSFGWDGKMILAV